MKLPKVHGSDLHRRGRAFPVDFAGELNLVFIAFQQWQQEHVDTWVPFAAQLEDEVPGFHFYEFPTIRQMNLLSRTFINEGMRAGIQDAETRARTITLYLNKEAFRDALDIPNENNIWVYLFDQDGNVLWRASGPFDLKLGEGLRQVIAERLLAVA